MREAKKHELSYAEAMIHPKEAIKQLVEVSIYALYGVEVKADIKSIKDIPKVESEFPIDYVFTCFSLSNALQANPQDVAGRLLEQCRRQIARLYPELKTKLHIQAIHGYLNFGLADEYLSESSYFAAHWLSQPDQRVKKDRTAFFVTHVDSSDFAASVEMIHYLEYVYGELGCSVSGNLIIDKDAPPPKAGHAKLIDESFDVRSERITSTTVSSLDPIVARWLDLLPEKKKFYKDPHSKAAYYEIEKELLIPLRSSKGILFKAAYLASAVEEVLREVRHHKDVVIVVAPQKFHQFIYDFTAPHVVTDKNQVYCLDAAKTCNRAVFTEGIQTLRSGLLFRDIAHTLARGIDKKIHSKENRVQLITLLDFPVELDRLAIQMKIPDSLDLIVEAKSALEALK